MPIYEFECKACGDVQEVMQKLSDPQPSECPVCHGGPLVKLMSRTGFILKGGGWYVTDFRDGGKKPSTLPVLRRARRKPPEPVPHQVAGPVGAVAESRHT